MRAAVLCPGPSLARLAALPIADLTVAVNRAALWWPCDAWSCVDWTSETPAGPGGIRAWADAVIGVPLLVSIADSLVALERHRIPWRGLSIAAETIDTIKGIDPVGRWRWFSATVAIVYTAHAGARAIDVYGADMAGTADADGARAGSDRTDDRWNKERRRWDEATAALAQIGVSVVRH